LCAVALIVREKQAFRGKRAQAYPRNSGAPAASTRYGTPLAAMVL